MKKLGAAVCLFVVCATVAAQEALPETLTVKTEKLVQLIAAFEAAIQVNAELEAQNEALKRELKKLKSQTCA